MLSRTADHLYWMARYTERAENLARMLEVNYRMSLLPQGAEIVEQGWAATLTIIGLIDAFKQRYDAVTPANAIAFLAFDRDNPMMVHEGHGFLDPLAVAKALPAWLREEDIQKFANEYRRTGFRGGLNWYRNIDRNWELTAPWQDATIRQPALFIVGTRDPVIAGKRGLAAVEHMSRAVPGVRKVMIEGAGHWIQQERPDPVNAALLEFLGKVRT